MYLPSNNSSPRRIFGRRFSLGTSARIRTSSARFGVWLLSQEHARIAMARDSRQRGFPKTALAPKSRGGVTEGSRTLACCSTGSRAYRIHHGHHDTFACDRMRCRKTIKPRRSSDEWTVWESNPPRRLCKSRPSLTTVQPFDSRGPPGIRTRPAFLRGTPAANNSSGPKQRCRTRIVSGEFRKGKSNARMFLILSSQGETRTRMPIKGTAF